MNKKVVIVLALAAVATLATVAVLRSGKSGEIRDLVTSTLRGSKTDANLTSLYESWKKQNNKTYGGAESQKRFGIFVENFKTYEKINSENRTFTVGINQFSDLTNQEFTSIYLGRKANYTVRPSNEAIIRINKTLKDGSIDWRTKGAVTPVKDQGKCGSCWAHSTVGSLEGFNAITNGKLVAFSEQQLVDCSRSYGNQGCNGGMGSAGLKYTAANGIATSATYPYKALDGKCTYTSSQQAFRNKAHKTANSDSALEAALKITPVAVSVAAGNQYFQGYTGGVLDAKSCGTRLDHEITAVGFGADAKGGFWILKNSWTTKWGESGYIRIARTTGSGICGMYQDNVYPTL